MQDENKFGKMEYLSILKRVSKEIEIDIDGYLIGGLAMIHHGSKLATKDVDIVFTSEGDAEIFENGSAKLDFVKEEVLDTNYKQLGTRTVLRSPEGHQFDVFVNTICRGLSLTTGMQVRAEKIDSFGKLHLYAVSIEDIFLFKSITDRPDDLLDMVILAGSGLKWDLIEKELRSQPESKKWIPKLYSRLSELKSAHGIVSPILKNIKEEAVFYIGFEIVLTNLEKGPLTMTDLNKIINEDPAFVKKIIERMKELKLIEEKNGVINKI